MKLIVKVFIVLTFVFYAVSAFATPPCDTDNYSCCANWDDNGNCTNWEIRVPTGNYGCSIGSFKGVDAKSNDGEIGTGCGRWQCVEYIKRFYYEAMGINLYKPIGIARNYWDKYDNTGDYSYIKNSGLEKCNNDFSCRLNLGDILVFSTAPYGHVAIEVNENGSQIKIIEQNYRSDDNSERYLDIQTQNTKYKILDNTVIGWLHMPIGEFGDDAYLRNGSFIAKGWHFDSDIQGQSDHYNLNSRPFTVCYQVNGGREVFGKITNKVHRFPDEDSPYLSAPYNNMRFAWVQDTSNQSTGKSYTFVVNEYVLNTNTGYMGVAYWLEGPIRNYFFNHYWEIGYPVTNMYPYSGNYSSDPPRYVVQWFERLDEEYYVVIYDTWENRVWHEKEGVTGVPRENFNQHKENNCTPISEGYGGGPMITDPTNLTAGPVSDSAIELVFNLPEIVNTGSWSVKVYQNSSFLNTCALTNRIIVNGLSASTNYCYTVSVLNNATKEESGLSNSVCAETNSLPPPASYNIVAATICSLVQNSAPYDCLNTEGSFPMSPGVNIYAWCRISNSEQLNCQWRLYYQSNGVLIYNAQTGGPPAYVGTNLNYFNSSEQKVTTYCQIEANSLPAWIGQYRVELWIGGVLVKTMYFNLILSTPSKPIVISNTDDNFIKLRADLVSGADIYQLYRDGNYISNFAPDFTFTDIDLESGKQYEYRVIAVSDNGFLSGLSPACVVTYTPAADITPPQIPTGITIQVVP